MPLSDIASITITTQTVSAQAPGFGIPLILAPNATYAERVRFYTSLSGVAVDFATTTPEYEAAAAIFAQSPRVPRIATGRLALKPTQRFAITPVAGNAVNYKMYINGNTVSVTSDGDGTVTEIIGLLKTAIDLLSLGVTTSDQTTHLRIVANSAGAHFDVSVDDPAKLGIKQDHADPGAATDLDAIIAENNDWYGVVNCFNSRDMAVAIAGWVESNKKLFVCDSQESDTITVATGSDSTSTGTIAKKISSDARTRTAVIYHPENGDHAGAAWIGAMFAKDPGRATWAHKSLSGVTVETLTPTHIVNLEAKDCNYFYAPAGTVGHTYWGNVGSGQYIDVIRDQDWFEASLQTRIYNVLSAADKIAFTDEGIAIIAGEVRAQLQEGIRVGFLAAQPEPVVTVPLAADVDAEDKAARLLPDISFEATLAGAIHKTTLRGTISL